MNNETLFIDEHIISCGREVCRSISNPQIRNRAVANVVAACIAKEYFSDYEIDTTSALHNISAILKNWET